MRLGHPCLVQQSPAQHEASSPSFAPLYRKSSWKTQGCPGFWCVGEPCHRFSGAGPQPRLGTRRFLDSTSTVDTTSSSPSGEFSPLSEKEFSGKSMGTVFQVESKSSTILICTKYSNCCILVPGTRCRISTAPRTKTLQLHFEKVLTEQKNKAKKYLQTPYTKI